MTEAEPKRTVRDTIFEISKAINREDFGTGKLAELRRLDVNEPIVSGVVHILLAEHLPAQQLGDDALRRWALILKLCAMDAQVVGYSNHGFAADLAEAEVSESRFTNFLAARGRKLDVSVDRLAKMLISDNVAIDVVGLGAYLIAEIKDGDRADEMRVRFASDFYRVKHRKDKEKQAA